MSEKLVKKVDIRNRKASFEYYFVEEFTAGMALTGTEIKSIRQGKVNFQDAYCLFMDGELYIQKVRTIIMIRCAIGNYWLQSGK